MARGITLALDEHIAIMAGMYHARISGLEALRASNVLLHDQVLDEKIRFQRKDQGCVISASDFCRVVEGMPRAHVRYTKDQVREFIRSNVAGTHTLTRKDFPVVERGENNEPIHKYFPHGAEVTTGH